MTNSYTKSAIAIEISPLIENHYTGISNVAYEIALRALEDSTISVCFFAGNRIIDNEVIRSCVRMRNGTKLQKFLAESRSDRNDFPGGEIDGRKVAALFTNTKPKSKAFAVESQIFYDFSTLIVPECHAEETVRYHGSGMIQQIATCDDLFCISEATASDLREIFEVEDSALHVIPLGSNVDLLQLEATRKFIADSILGVEPYILVLGTIEPRKNLKLILQWLRSHEVVTTAYRFVFVGRYGWGPTFQELLESADSMHLYSSGRISWYGYVDEKIKASLLAGASGLIYPSIFEGFGLPVLEAMSAGVIVMSSSSSSMPEVLGDCGYYFNPESVDSLNNVFTQFCRDKMLGVHEQKKQGALERSRIFSYDKAYEMIVSVLTQRLNQTEPKSRGNISPR